MSQKHLILISLALFAAGAAFLFWQNERELDPDRGKDWWTLSFAIPSSPGSLAFTVENHSDQTDFRYEIIVDRQTLSEETFELKRGATTTIAPELGAHPDARTSVTVTAGMEKKEIYR